MICYFKLINRFFIFKDISPKQIHLLIKETKITVFELNSMNVCKK